MLLSTAIENGNINFRMHSQLTDHFALSTLISSVAKEPRPFLVPRTLKGEQAIERLHDTGPVGAQISARFYDWSLNIQEKLEIHRLKAVTGGSQMVETTCLRLFFAPQKQGYATWLADVKALAEKLQSNSF